MVTLKEVGSDWRGGSYRPGGPSSSTSCIFHWTIWLALGLTLICTPMLIWLVENLVLVSGEPGVGERG